MKKFYLLLIIVCTLYSCTNDSSSEIQSDSNLLQRIDFYPGMAAEARWLFNADGLLYKITKADGTVIQEFTYDSQNRLVQSDQYYWIEEHHTFTYDSNDLVATVDGAVVHYDSGLDAYYTGILNDNYRLTKINSDKLLLDGRTVRVDNDETGITQTEWEEMLVYYSNNNVMGYTPGDSCVSFTYDSKTNPLRSATLAISRAFSFVPNSRWVNGLVNSANNPLSQRYCSEDPESEVFHYTYNSNNLPKEQTLDSYYFGTLERTMVSAKYYYQGDVLP
jgi:hypothetical protein